MQKVLKKTIVKDLLLFTPEDFGEMAPGSYNSAVRAMSDFRLRFETPAQTMGCRGVWYWGVPGAGKSHQARNMYPDAFIKS